MNHFDYQRDTLFADGVPLTAIAESVGTPTYVYARATLERHFRVVNDAFERQGAKPLICYAVKANSNLALLSLFAELGSGFDIVSGGELERVRAAGASPSKVVFSGVGKTTDEMERGLRAGILMFNVESAEELETLDAVARRLKKKAPFSIRVNPDVDAKTHKYISTGLKTSKFGVPFKEAVGLYEKSRSMKGLSAIGVDCHIGSQLTDSTPMRDALQLVARFYSDLKAKGHPLQYLDVGGGLGITYSEEKPPSPDEYARVVLKAVKDTGATIVLEPGRVLVGNAGVLLTRVLYRKKTAAKTFVIVDAGMNDLIRPALYEAHHELRPVVKRRGRSATVDVVGPVCESSDFLAKDRRLVMPGRGELFAVMSAGAYGMSMASTYNSRPRPAEVLVDGRGYTVIREREELSELWRGEQRGKR